MAYIGAVAPGYDPTRASVPQLDAERFNGNASTTAFTLTRQVVSPTDINVIVENVLQEPTVAYSVSGYTLNFTEAPPTGTNNIYVIYRGSGISNYAFVPDGSITFAKLANNIKQFTVDNFTANGTGSTVELTEAPASANAVIVSVDGVIQTAPTNYTLSGSTITFTGVPDNGANVVVKHIGFRTTSTVTALQASSVTATELADSSVTNAKIVSVANTKISGNIVSSQITSVANTQISGNIISSQIAPSVTLTTPIISGNLNLDSAGTTSIRVPSANAISFHTAGTEDMRIDANGNVGIGTASASYKTHIVNATGGNTLVLDNGGGTGDGNSTYLAFSGTNTGANYVRGRIRGAFPDATGGGLTFETGSSGSMTERMRIGTDGNMMIGATSFPAFGSGPKLYVQGDGNGISVGYGTTTSQYRIMYFNSGDATMYFHNNSNYASLSGAGAWTNASDVRLKKNIVDIKYGLADVARMQPRSYQMNDVAGDFVGFVAQELQTVIPEVVSGDPEKQLGVDYGSLVAVAFKAIQELKTLNDTQAATITALTARIVALES